MVKKYDPMTRLRIKRIEANLTQKELAKRIGVTSNSYSCYETGVRFPRRDILDKIAAELKCEIKDIV